MKDKFSVPDIWALCFTVSLGIANFVIFGLVHALGWKDAAQYSAYAVNMLLGRGYSLDGNTIDAFREPGVAVYLSFFYMVFGAESPTAVFAALFVQGIIVGILGFLMYKVVKQVAPLWLALLTGSCIAFLPILGDHANEVGTETMFTLFLGIIFYISLKIVRAIPNTQWYWYALLGLACGIETLIRFQFVLFLPFLIACFLMYAWYVKVLSAPLIRNLIVSLIIFATLPVSFATYIHAHTGVFAVSEGRQREMLFTRTDRTAVGISGQTRYLGDWLLRSISGGYNSQYLADHDYQKSHDRYVAMATTSEAIARIHARSLHIIREHPVSYLYGNFVESVKLFYIEHDYSDTWSRYFRPLQYACIYLFFLFGLYQLIWTKANWDTRSMQILALLFIFYNTATLSFLYTVPRFNTPYLPLIILIGFLGVVLYRRKKIAAQKGIYTAHEDMKTYADEKRIALTLMALCILSSSGLYIYSSNQPPLVIECRSDTPIPPYNSCLDRKTGITYSAQEWNAKW